MDVGKLKFINCVKLADILGVTRHRAGFILKYFEQIGSIQLYNPVTSRRYNYQIIDIGLLQKGIDAAKNNKLDKRLKQFRIDVSNREFVGPVPAGV